MTDFDFKAAKQSIKEILSIVDDCPEPLKEKCFELLFNAVFSGAGFGKTLPKKTTQHPDQANEADNGKNEGAVVGDAGERKLPGNVIAFTRKYGVSQQQLEKLFLLDHDPLLPIYKIDTKITAQAQLQKVMMVLLENGLLNDKLKVPYTELRESVKEDGLMDGNFNKTLKQNAALFKGAITKSKIVDTEAVELTGEGMQRLADIVTELAGPAE